MELENLFSDLNLNYQYNSEDNLKIINEIIQNENINEIYKLCNYVLKNFVTDENHVIYKDLFSDDKKKIKRIRELLNTIISIYPFNKQLILYHFTEFRDLCFNLCFT